MMAPLTPWCIRQGGASMPISGVAAAKWRTFHVMIVAAPAFNAHAAMSMS